MVKILELINNDTFNNLIGIANTIITFVLTSTALYYTIKTYGLKSGQNIRGSYTTSSSIYCEDRYVHAVELENYKDKAIVIYNIYLKIGHNYYLELENFESKPLILNPFELYKKEYDPIDLYSIDLNYVSIDELFDDKKVKKQIVLSTSNGKYKVRKPIKHWNPIFCFFKNNNIGIIHINRATYQNKCYGYNSKYIVHFKYSNGKEEIVPIYNDNKFNKFRKFNLTKEHIESKSKLEMFLNEMKSQEKLKCNTFEIIDIESYRNELYKDYNNDKIELNYYNWFNHYVIGRIITIYDNYKCHRKNKQKRKRNEEVTYSQQASKES